MSMAIKYHMMKKAKGGPCAAHGADMCEMCHGGKAMASGGEMGEDEESRDLPHYDKEKGKEVSKSFMKFSKGGAVHEDDRMLNQHGEIEEGAEGSFEDNEAPEMHNYAHKEENQDDHEDMVGHIMKQRQKHFSKGGRVANDVGEGQEVDKMPNQYDDLVLRDDLEEHYTGANSGDELGNAKHDEDDADMIAQIMKSRRKKDRLPNPR